MNKIQNFYTDKGSVSVKTRNALKLDYLPIVKEALQSKFENVLIGTDGAYYAPIGEANGHYVYVRLEMTISVKSPN